MMKRLLIAGNVLAISLVVLYGVWEYGAPYMARMLWKEQYQGLMFKCDQAMREHYIAKRAVTVKPNKATVRNLEAAEVALLDCHQYDKLRKKLLTWGLSDEDLALLGLETMESKAYELRKFVEVHEIRY